MRLANYILRIRFSFRHVRKQKAGLSSLPFYFPPPASSTAAPLATCSGFSAPYAHGPWWLILLAPVPQMLVVGDMVPLGTSFTPVIIDGPVSHGTFFDRDRAPNCKMNFAAR